MTKPTLYRVVLINENPLPSIFQKVGLTEGQSQARSKVYIITYCRDFKPFLGHELLGESDESH